MTLEMIKQEQFKKGFKDGEEKGFKDGEEKGIIKTSINIYREVGLTDQEIIDKIKKNENIAEEEIRKYL